METPSRTEVIVSDNPLNGHSPFNKERSQHSYQLSGSLHGGGDKRVYFTKFALPAATVVISIETHKIQFKINHPVAPAPPDPLSWSNATP